jgi:lipopolysaccharide biosynthesis glycosyltransferase
MDPVGIALASNERYFPGLYCAVTSALSQLDVARKVDLKVLDGGISSTSRDTLSRFIDRVGEHVRLEFVTVDDSIFRDATLGPAESYMTYCRILLPCLLDVPRLIYLDCDALVFRDLSELFDLQLPSGKILAAVRDSETLSLGDDSQIVTDAMKLPAQGVYFNCGVMLMNLDELRRENFMEQSLAFLRTWSGHYRFHDQSAINFLLHGRIHELPESWNRAAWRFNKQSDNNLNCVLHYTSSPPWLRETPGPAQVLFERFATEAGLPVNRDALPFKKSRRQGLWQNGLAPLRTLAFSVASLVYRIVGREDKSAAYRKAARYWFDYIRNAPSRRRVHRHRSQQIDSMKFNSAASVTTP